ncbi:MAG: FAD-dependent oxidoreductase, partial [Ferruginibacter sp.]|nr:FAD-dependent oxidoreductase [Cytophagales bacterium]
VRSEFVLVNAGPNVLARLRGEAYAASREDEGSVFKVNLLCRQLPQLKDGLGAAAEAFAGTFHLDEGYQAMRTSYQRASAGQLPDRLPADVYCHTLTDGSILSEELQQEGFHTLALFGLDMPYSLFERDHDGMKQTVLRRYLDGLSHYLAEPIGFYLATDRAGNPCVEAKSPVDLERELGLHRGNIFHNALTFPFASHPAEVGTWGVETGCDKVYLCGSGARRGGAVSGIPGHNAAMKVLGN